MVDVGSKDYGSKILLKNLASMKTLYFKSNSIDIVKSFLPNLYTEFCNRIIFKYKS